jgi:predicted glutamine amidotransferase
MCRIFFIMNTKNKKEKVMEFLSQSTHKIKNTPGVDNSFENSFHLDGYGFSWLSNKKWRTYKSPELYLQDTHLEKKLPKRLKSNIVIGHIRNKIYGKASKENTHPFFFKNQVFFHNGFVKDFMKHKEEIMAKVDKKYHSHIKGETDSECLFYLFLTIKDFIAAQPKTDQFMVDISKLFFQTLREMNLSCLVNIIFTDDKYIVVSRYSILMHTTKDSNLSLYYDNTEGVVITSEPITTNYKLVPENSILIMEH